MKFLHGILIGVVAGVLSLVLHFTGVLGWAEAWTWSIRARELARPTPATDQIVLIQIDEGSLAWADDKGIYWPWPRDAYTLILSFCESGGAKVVAFDMLFPGRNDRDLEADRTFGEAMAANGRAVAAMQASRGRNRRDSWPSELASKHPAVSGLTEYLAAHPQSPVRAATASFPIPEVGAGAAVVGHVLEAPSRNELIFHDVPFIVFADRFVPSLGLGAYLAAHPEARLDLTPTALQVDDYQVPLDEVGRTVLHFRGPTQTHRTYPAALIMNSQLQLMEGKTPQLDPAVLKDKYVFLGLSGDAAADLWRTPVGLLVGQETHATFLDNLLTGDLIRNAPAALVVLLTLGLAILAGTACRSSQRGWHLAVLALVTLPIPVVTGIAAYAHNVWLPVVVPELSLALAMVGAIAVNYAMEGRQKRYLKNAFQQYLSPAVIERLIRNPESLRLGGETRELSLFFSDIQGFTSISEALTPAALTDLLNQYLTAMTDIIYEENGTIDKYEGDAIIAFWNAPLDDPSHAVNAVRAALRCQRKLVEMREPWRQIAGREIRARVGVNSGEVVIGNMGSRQRFNYTFLGDAGNLASRLEGVNKQFGTYVMISDLTRLQLTDEFACRELGRVRVVGRHEPVVVYEPMFKADYAARPYMVNFAEALKRFYDGQFSEALQLFASMAEEDPPAMVYCRLCRKYQKDPPAAWDGVLEMTEK